MTTNVIVMVAAFGVAVAWFSTQIHRAEERGVQAEQSRVSQKAEANHGKAQAARRAVTDDSVGRMLEKYYRRDQP